MGCGPQEKSRRLRFLGVNFFARNFCGVFNWLSDFPILCLPFQPGVVNNCPLAKSARHFGSEPTTLRVLLHSCGQAVGFFLVDLAMPGELISKERTQPDDGTRNR